MLIGLTAGLLVFGISGCDSSTPPAGAPAAAPAPPPALPGMPDPSGKNPKVEVVDGETFDFGTKEAGEVFEHVFVIKNIGEADMTLEKGDPSCGTCTSFTVDKTLVKPGESAKATVRWHVKNENPEFSQYAPIFTNDPNRQSVKLYAKCKVLNRIVLSPIQSWDMGTIAEGVGATFKATLTSAIVDQFQIESVTNTSPQLKVTATPMSAERLAEMKAKAGYELVAVLSKSIPIGKFDDKVTIKVLAPEAKSLVVDVTASRSGPLEIFGPSYVPERTALALGAFDPKEPFVSKLNLFTRGIKDELKITKVECEDSRFTFELKPDTKLKPGSGDYRRYELLVKVAASNRDAVYASQHPLRVVIDTNQELIGQIKLRITCQAIP